MAPSNTMASASGGIDASRDSVHPPGYAIPEKYKARLEEVQVKDKDTRSDEEIIAMLKNHVPVTSEKNIWGYWHSGIDGMPDWCRRNVLDWIRMLGPSWTVRIVDNQPGSPNHFLQFISPEMVPECFINGTHHGKFQGPHSADFVRVPLVYLYGGASLDVGTYLTRHPERWMWEPLDDETSGVEVIISLFYGSVLSNSFVAAKKGNKWMKRWNDALLHVWKDRDSHEGLVMHPMLAFTHNITFEETRASGNLWEYVLEPQECIEYLTQMFLWVRMTMLEGNGDPDDFDYASYWQTKVRALNLHKETQAMDTLYKWHNAGPRHFELLTIPVHPPQPDNPDWQEAHDLVWHLLSETTMQKISTGRGVLDEKTLGILWPENPGKDAAENTFAHLLRYGALHFRQTRATVELAKCEKPKVTVKRGLLEYPPEGQPI